MNARNLFIACGIHANSITEQAAEELLAYNREQNQGLWAKGQEHGEYVPTWTGAVCTTEDVGRLRRWLEGHKAHGVKRMYVQPVNGVLWVWNNLPEISGFFITSVSSSSNTAYVVCYSRKQA